MREKKTYIIITFDTTTEAMALEKYCNRNEIPGRLIPLPREISAGCGLAWRILPEDFLQSKEKFSGINYGEIIELEL